MDITNKLKEITEPAVGPVMDMLSGLVLDGVAGAIVPGVGNLILSYKQQRTEKNLEMFISQIVARQNEFNERLNRLDPDRLQKITNHYFGIVTDYVLAVRQKDKINFIVNGYINLSDFQEFNDDAVIMYYDTLDQLTMVDIAVLKSHHINYRGDSANREFLEQLMRGQQRLINEKLERLGLFSSENQRKMDENVKNIGVYLQEVQKGKKNPNLKYSKVWGSDSYRLTDYGRKFLEFFMNEYQSEEVQE
ncbi:hypothetical protein [Lacrimispora sp.]|uniref:hypothetical protein n=1 Tax=Lacrimispora sp. TaxID=2719234 RepID=UPI0028AD60C7|nr:hypothetical protein [Lacrimispora sp.]